MSVLPQVGVVREHVPDPALPPGISRGRTPIATTGPELQPAAGWIVQTETWSGTVHVTRRSRDMAMAGDGLNGTRVAQSA